MTPKDTPADKAGLNAIFNHMLFAGKSLAQMQRIPKADLERADIAKAKLQKLIVEAVISELEWLISWDNPDTLDKVTIKDRINSLKGSVEEDK
jgi:DNA primase